MSLKISVFTEKDIPIFYNDNIKYRYNTLFHRKMIMANIRYLQDVLDREGAVRPMRDFPPQIRKEPDFMFIYSAIKTAIINSGKRNRLQPRNLKILVNKMMLLKNSDLRYIIDFNQAKDICGRSFWEKKFPLDDCFSRYLHSLRSIRETKLKVLIFKIFHNIFPTKILLKKWNMVDTDLCACGAKDFIEHALVECSLLAHLWEEVTKVIQQAINKQIILSTSTKIFGISKKN